MKVAGHTVHRIVATAFHGNAPSPKHIVDHIDTNRRNNRPENLRWVTRLENILLNPITAKRIELAYGSIEAFLADPRRPKSGPLPQNFEWMRTVSKSEAQASLDRLLAWAHSGSGRNGGTLGDWIFGRERDEISDEPKQLVPSHTQGAAQRNWKIPSSFPLCPLPTEENALVKYFERLHWGQVFAETPFGVSKVYRTALPGERSKLIVMCDHGSESLKQWAVTCVTSEVGQIVHESLGMFFKLDGARKEFTLAQGLEWRGGETFDDLVR